MGDTGNAWGIIALGTFLLAVLAVGGAWWWRSRQTGRRTAASSFRPPDRPPSIQDRVNRAAGGVPGEPAEIRLDSGTFTLDEGLRITRSVNLQGAGVEDTRITAAGNQPAVSIVNAKDCSLSHIRIEGKIHCSNGEVRLRDCQIVAREDGICIEAFGGSVVVFSGQIRGEGGIAIRAEGQSKVVLKPPYELSGEDYIVFDSHSRVSVEEAGEEPASSG